MKVREKCRIAALVVVMALVLAPVFTMLDQAKVVAASLSGDALSVAKIIGGDAQCTTIEDTNLILSEFGVVTFDDYEVNGIGDTEGKIAVGRNVVVNTSSGAYSVGSKATGLVAYINGTITGKNSLNFNSKDVALGKDSSEANAS